MSRRKMKLRRQRFQMTRRNMIGLFLAFLFLAPLAWSLLLSFKTSAESRKPLCTKYV